MNEEIKNTRKYVRKVTYNMYGVTSTGEKFSVKNLSTMHAVKKLAKVVRSIPEIERVRVTDPKGRVIIANLLG